MDKTSMRRTLLNFLAAMALTMTTGLLWAEPGSDNIAGGEDSGDPGRGLALVVAGDREDAQRASVRGQLLNVEDAQTMRRENESAFSSVSDAVARMQVRTAAE